ncbi:hypothetical protein DFH06DRAFT_1319379 [Mycena polygramma]|nr:hypothetical protein DFH06DRAFT_1319379 [Mycena polygramma]
MNILVTRWGCVIALEDPVGMFLDPLQSRRLLQEAWKLSDAQEASLKPLNALDLSKYWYKTPKHSFAFPDEDQEEEEDNVDGGEGAP